MVTLCVFALFSWAVAACDSRALRIPDRLLFPGAALLVLLSVTESGYGCSVTGVRATADSAQKCTSAQNLLPAFLAALLLLALFWALHALLPHALGFADVKLAPLLSWLTVFATGYTGFALFLLSLATAFFTASLTVIVREKLSGSGEAGRVFAAGPIMLIAAWATLASSRLLVAA